jgi:hypothetical protein
MITCWPVVRPKTLIDPMHANAGPVDDIAFLSVLLPSLAQTNHSLGTLWTLGLFEPAHWGRFNRDRCVGGSIIAILGERHKFLGPEAPR